MDLNEYDLLIEEEQKNPQNSNQNEYDELIAQEKNQQKTQVKEIVRVQSEKDPGRMAEVYNISKETGLPSNSVDRNLDKIKKRKKLDSFNYDELLEVNPGLAKWISNPDHAAVAHDEIEPLKKIEQNAIKIRPNKKEPGFASSLVNAGETGWNGLVSSGALLAAAYGRVDAETASNIIAGANLKAQSNRDQKPEFAREFDEELGSDVEDVDRRVSQLTGSFDEIGKGNILKGLRDFAEGNVMTVAETLELIGSAVIRPKGLIYSNVESLANSIPSLATGAAGAKAGAVAGAGAGSVVPVVGNAAGAAAGGIVGFGVGSFFGSAPTEIGASIAQDLTEKGYDLTDPMQVRKALANKELMKEVMDRAERKGVTTAAVDGLFNMVAGKLFAGARGASIGTKLKAGAQDVARDAVGEGLGEYAGSLAKEDGDFSKVSMGESILEGVVSLGSSVGDVAIGATNEVRSRYSQDTEQAAAEVAQDAQNAMESVKEVEALNEMGAAIKEARTTSQANEAIQNLVSATDTDGEASAVFFQSDDWDSYWSEKGESPVKKAYEISEDVGKSYAQSAATGSDFEIPLAQYAEKVGKTEDFEALNQKVKTRSDGMKLEDANETIKNIPGLLKQLSEEAATLEDQDFQDSVAEVKSRVKDQLKLAGMSDKDAALQAQLYEGRVKTRAMLRGQDPLQIFKDQNLQIQRQGQMTVRDNKTYDEMMRDRQQQKEFNEQRGIQEKSVDSLKGEVKDFAESIVADEISQMVYEVQQAEAGQRSGFQQVVGDGQGGGRTEFVNTSTQSTFPAWYKDLKVKNKDSFEKVVAKGRGKTYNRIKDIAIERLKNGYDNQHSGQVMPNNDFRAALGLLSVTESGMVEDDTFDLFQDEKAPKGRISVGKDFFKIELLAKADPSTFLHETGHLWLEEIKNDVMFVNAMPEDQLNETQTAFKHDVDLILKYLGVNSIHEIETEHHELWARSVEKYLMEGKAPTDALARAFTRFKTWLVSVYRQLRNIDAPLTDEVRGVMDRMLATELEIQEAQKAQRIKDITNPDMQSKVEKKKLKRYEQLRDLFNQDAKERMTKELMQSYKREREIFLSEERKKVKEQVENFLKNQRPHRALDIAKNGTNADGDPVKINRGELVSLFGEDVVKELPRELYTRKGGMVADVVANIAGYESVMEMVDELRRTPKLKDHVKALTDKRMREKYPDGFLEGQNLEEMAEKFVHSDKRGELLLMELSLLNDAEQAGLQEGTRKALRRIPSNDEIKKEAAAMLSGVKVKNIRPHLYSRAEVREARKVEELISKGDYAGAFEAKQRELLNYQLYRQARELREKKDKALKKFKNLKKKDEKLAKSRDMAFVNAARSILSRYGLAIAPEDAQANLDRIQDYDPDVYQMVMSVIDSVKIEPKDYRELTQAEFEEITDTFNALWDLSRSSRQIEIDGKKRDISEVAQELASKMERFKSKRPREEYDRAQTKWEGFQEALLTLKSKFRRVEHWVEVMDGGDYGGLFRKVFWQNVSDATDRYYEVKTEYNKRIVDMAKQVKVEAGEAVISKDLGYKFKDKSEILGAMLHMGNESNLKKLLVGRGWGSLNEDGTLNTQKWDAFLQDMYDREILTKKDLDFVQGLWDLMEEIKPQAQKAHKQIFGHYFSEITANEFETPFGKYRGGYAPAKVDYTKVRDAKRREELKEFTENNPSYAFPGSGGSGFAKGRQENYNKPLQLDINLVVNHVDDVLRFAIVKPEVVNAAKIATSKEFREAMDEIDPTIVDGMIKPALVRADKNRRSDINPNSVNILNRGAAQLRKAMSANIMFMNIVNTVEQFTGFMAASTKMPYKALYSGAMFYLRNPKQVSAIIDEKSSYMRTKTDDSMYEFQRKAKELFKADTTVEKVKDFADKNTYIAQIVTQDFIDKMVWVSAYNDAIEKGESEKVAITKADSVIRTTQNAARPLDIAAFQGNGLLNVVQMFMGYFNMVANLNATNFTNLYYSEMGMKQKYIKGFQLYWSGYASLAILSAALRKAAAGGLDEDEDGDYLDDLYDVVVTSQVEFGLAMIPLLGQAVNAGLNRGNDKFYDDRMSASPVFEALSVTVDYAVPDALSSKGAFERANVRDALTALGVVSGIPLRPLAKPYQYLKDVDSGEADPTGPIDFTRGLVTGKPGNN